VLGIDPSLKNLGIAKCELDLQNGEITVLDLILVQTEKDQNKTIRRNSDDLNRARKLHKFFTTYTEWADFVFSEIPTGAQSARAALSFGIAIGVLASCNKPLIQVMPTETKLHTVGTKTASKEEMIEWATEKYPGAPWLTAKSKGVTRFTNDNEHLADAVAVVHAGVETEQFQQLIALSKLHSAA